MVIDVAELKFAQSYFNGDHNFSTDIQESNRMKMSIDEFCGSNQISGRAWDNVRGNLKTYSDALDSRTKLAAKLGNTITSILEDLINYMTNDDGNGVYSSLDISKIEDVKKEIEKMEQSVKELKESIYKLFKYNKSTNENGEEVLTKVPDLDARSYVGKKIQEIQDTIKEFQKCLNKMIILSQKVDDAFAALDNVKAEVKEFERAFASIVPGESVLFTDYSI